MSNLSNKRKKSNYFEEIEEWQDHQYDPGYYTGGKIPPFLKYPRWTKITGSLYLLGGLLLFFLLAIPFIITFNKNELGEWIVTFVLFGGIGVVYILAGLKFIKKARLNKRKFVRKLKR